MVYRKRRYNRRYKNKTKKFNRYAYAKTDSKNQSKQIVRLNKKIDNVYKTLRPELLKRHNTGSFSISSTEFTVLPLDSLLNLSASESLNNLFKGNYAKFIYFNFKFFFNSTNIDLTKGKSLRVVIIQNRYGRETLPTSSDIFLNSSQSILSPLSVGINNNYKILLNKNYIISSDRDYLYKSYNFKKLIGYNPLANSTTTLPKYARGSIFIIFITTQVEEFSVNYNCRLGYVDTIPSMKD